MKHIILLGPKNSGKTTIGKVLTSLYSCEFLDLDEEIKRQTGKTPRELYNESIDIFQKVEADTLRSLRLCVFARGILSTGGGIIDNEQAVSILKELNAVKVYLSISAETAWQRISAAGELPPFLQTDNPQKTHRALHERRAKAYSQIADITIEADNKTPEEIAAEIKSKII